MAKESKYHVSRRGDKLYVYNNKGNCCTDGYLKWEDAQAARWELEGWGVLPQRRAGNNLNTNN